MDKDSNYYMGIMSLYGLGTKADIERSVEHFSRAKNDSRS